MMDNEEHYRVWVNTYNEQLNYLFRILSTEVPEVNGNSEDVFNRFCIFVYNKSSGDIFTTG